MGNVDLRSLNITGLVLIAGGIIHEQGKSWVLLFSLHVKYGGFMHTKVAVDLRHVYIRRHSGRFKSA
jgi:hypothetical protein